MPGPDYLIGADLGQQHGGNLFHSFQDFNLQSHESATFSGPNSVQNILSRVTGGHPSNIDGLIRATIPNANLYFLNPYGMMFGPNARLDVQGSFHASTADYLRLSDGSQFNARLPNNSLLTIAPVEAFGFLTDSPASFSIEGSQLRTYPQKNFSLMGGAITINAARIHAPGGQINLASVASTGEVVPIEDGLDVASFNQFGNITIANDAIVTTSGKGSGDIYIRGGQLTLNQSKLNANTLENGEKGKIDIQVNRLNLIGGPQIGRIGRDKIVFDTAISSATISDGEGGNISIKATEAVNLTNAAIFANSGELDIQITEGSTEPSITPPQTRGNAGTILIETDQLNLDNAVIESNAFGIGQGGNITLKVNGHTTMSEAHIAVNAFEGTDVSAERVGSILLETEQLTLTNVVISSNTFGSGSGGNITLKVDGSMTLSQSFIMVDAKTFKAHSPTPKHHKQAIVDKNTARRSTGEAGTILIEARELTLTDGSKISSSTSSTGDGGNVTIYVLESITLQNPVGRDNAAQNSRKSSIEAVSSSQQPDSGNAGGIWLETQRLTLTDKAIINTSSMGGGDAGHIYLTVAKLDMSNKAKIASSNKGNGNAGNLTINVQDHLHLQEAYMTTEATNAEGGDITLNIGQLVYLLDSGITTSVRGGSGNGGNITIESPVLVVLNQGQVRAQANRGQGGNIRITSEQFIASPDSLVSASSRLGIDGNVEIDSPTVNMDEFLVVLPADFLDVSSQLRSPCTLTRRGQNKSSFVVKRFAGSPPSPDDWKSTRLVLLQAADEKTSKTNTLPSMKSHFATAGHSAHPLARLTGCRPDFSTPPAPVRRSASQKHGNWELGIKPKY